MWSTRRKERIPWKGEDWVWIARKIKIRVGMQVRWLPSCDGRTKLNLSVSVPPPQGSGDGARRTGSWNSCSRRWTHVRTNSSGMSQCATVCRNIPEGRTLLWKSPNRLWHRSFWPGCRLHVTGLDEKWNLANILLKHFWGRAGKHHPPAQWLQNPPRWSGKCH